METLAPRQKLIMELLAQGLSNQQIADDLGVKRTTIKTQLQYIYRKYRVTTRTQAVWQYTLEKQKIEQRIREENRENG